MTRGSCGSRRRNAPRRRRSCCAGTSSTGSSRSKSTNAERIAENAAIFHFALTESEVEELDEALSRLDLTAARQ